jgi:hypothetical protein
MVQNQIALVQGLWGERTKTPPSPITQAGNQFINACLLLWEGLAPKT